MYLGCSDFSINIEYNIREYLWYGHVMLNIASLLSIKEWNNIKG